MTFSIIFLIFDLSTMESITGARNCLRSIRSTKRSPSGIDSNPLKIIMNLSRCKRQEITAGQSLYWKSSDKTLRNKNKAVHFWTTLGVIEQTSRTICSIVAITSRSCIHKQKRLFRQAHLCYGKEIRLTQVELPYSLSGQVLLVCDKYYIW